MIGDAEFAVLDRVARWCGCELTAAMRAQLDRFVSWLQDEAVPAGGLGPREIPRLVRRHVADSLAFAQPLCSRPPASLVDLGSGVGLPGVPLAVLMPEVAVTLLDRGGRRVDLAQRAIRVVGLDNVEVVQGDVRDPLRRFDAVTMRAVVPPDQAVRVVRPWLSEGGIGVVGVRHGGAAPLLELEAGVDLTEIPPDVLDSPGWLLTIRP